MPTSDLVYPGHDRVTGLSPGRWRRRSATLLALAVLSLFESSALAKGGFAWEESDKLPAVQNRKYRMEHEFFAGVGLLPVDAFYKGAEFMGGYVFHINDLWAVEGRYSYLRNIKTSLRDKLEQNWGEPASKFAKLLHVGELNCLFKPIYGKLSFLNHNLLYGEIYLNLGAVVAQLDGGTPTDEELAGKGKRMGYGATPGFGFRGFLSPRFSVRFDFRYLLLYSAGEGHFPLSLSLTLAYTTRSDR